MACRLKIGTDIGLDMDINMEIEIYKRNNWQSPSKILSPTPSEVLPTIIFIGIYKNTVIIKWPFLAKPHVTKLEQKEQVTLSVESKLQT